MKLVDKYKLAVDRLFEKLSLELELDKELRIFLDRSAYIRLCILNYHIVKHQLIYGIHVDGMTYMFSYANQDEVWKVLETLRKNF